jgi:hypothetical protein
VALLEDRPKTVRPVAAKPAEAPALRAAPARTVIPAAAWLLDLAAFHQEFGALWESLGEPTDRRGTDRAVLDAVHPGTDRVAHGDTTAMRLRAAEVWNASDRTTAEVVARLDVTAPDDWIASPDDRQLGHWFRLVMAAHLMPAPAPAGVDELRSGLPQLGLTHAEARRAAWGRELGDLAVALAPNTYGPAVSLSLGHGHKGWLGADDAGRLQERLAAVPPSTFRTAQHLVAPCEALWCLLDQVVASPGRALVLFTA